MASGERDAEVRIYDLGGIFQSKPEANVPSAASLSAQRFSRVASNMYLKPILTGDFATGAHITEENAPFSKNLLFERLHSHLRDLAARFSFCLARFYECKGTLDAETTSTCPSVLFQ